VPGDVCQCKTLTLSLSPLLLVHSSLSSSRMALRTERNRVSQQYMRFDRSKATMFCRCSPLAHIPSTTVEAYPTSATLDQREEHTTTRVGSFGYTPPSLSITSHPSSTEVPALWTEHRSNRESPPRAEQRNFRNRTYARQQEGETPALPLEEVIRRQGRLIWLLRRKIRELRETLVEMRRIHTEDDMEDLVDNMETMHVDTC
jgi:hypothetical protein